MAGNSGSRKRKLTVKALAQVEVDLARKSSSAKKAAARKRVTSGEENCCPATATPVPITSPAPTSTSASVRRTRTGVLPVVPASDNGATAATVSQVHQDSNTISEVANLRGEYLFCARPENKLFFLFFSSACCCDAGSQGSLRGSSWSWSALHCKGPP